MSPKKAISMLVLMGASAAVWVPQILDSTGGLDQSTPVEIELAEPGLLESGEYEDDASESFSGAPLALEGTDGSSASGAGSAGLSKLVADSGLGVEVDQGLSTLLGSMRSFRPEGQIIPDTNNSEGQEASNSRLGLFEVKLAIADNPLTAILIHPKRSRAVMGARVVGVGDEISAGLTVHRIEADGVWLDTDVGLMQVSLPAVRARAASAGEGREEVEVWKNAEEAATEPLPSTDASETETTQEQVPGV